MHQTDLETGLRDSLEHALDSLRWSGGPGTSQDGSFFGCSNRHADSQITPSTVETVTVPQRLLLYRF